ncbi:hypothetical protein B0H17DRAFT_1145498 [Mycena rosella]|uniref:Uncharacterized protein n=1 Tax=Mycena rosella TaxID=1033263 RepID=A0AAD7CR01_MYCRO|nr:hypothetical protein B0H17DRAFT_1145498 [Mycena rosella]
MYGQTCMDSAGSSTAHTTRHGKSVMRKTHSAPLHKLVSAHCYEAMDMDALIHLSNEFKFPIPPSTTPVRPLSPTSLKKLGAASPPSPSLHPTSGNFFLPNGKKYEAYHGSEFVPQILMDSGLPVIIKVVFPLLP